jgi:hypothetical protein
MKPPAVQRSNVATVERSGKFWSFYWYADHRRWTSRDLGLPTWRTPKEAEQVARNVGFGKVNFDLTDHVQRGKK